MFHGSDVELAVDQHRVVWHAAGPSGDLDIYFCEDDARTGACPVQRLTGSATDQRNPEISGTRLVWEDDREGETMIAGFELPSLDPVSDRSAGVGRPLRIAVRGRNPAGAIALSAAFADGTPLAARGALFIDRGDGTGALEWTPGAGDLGTHIVTFAGRTAGRLTNVSGGPARSANALTRLNRLASASRSATGTATLGYDEDGRLTTRTSVRIQVSSPRAAP